MSQVAGRSKFMGADTPASPGHNQPVEAALAQARAAYQDRNPGSAGLYARAQAVMPGGNTRSALYFEPFPLYVASSAGAHIRDVDGHDYLDVLGEFTAGLYGHGDPDIRESVSATLANGISNGAPAETEIRLAELMCARFPSLERVRFCNSGTEANLYALTLARIATGRQKIIVFTGAYHGGVFVFGGGGSPMNLPFDWTLCTYNDVEGVTEAIARLGQTLAAVIVEPMFSNGGCIPARADFLQVIRQGTAAQGALLIFDEVVTSRMGAGGLQGRYAITPDLTTFGKYLGAGFSFGAFGGRADLMDRLDPRRQDALPHAGTFNNNVFSMTAGAMALERIFTPERAEKLFENGEALRRRLNDMAARIAPQVQFTGCGSVLNIHFHGGAITCPADLAHEPKLFFDLFHFDMMADGIYAARRGQINLSLPMTSADFDRIEQAVEGFLECRAVLLRGIATDGRP